mgnify:CR=1 FL=1
MTAATLLAVLAWLVLALQAVERADRFRALRVASEAQEQEQRERAVGGVAAPRVVRRQLDEGARDEGGEDYRRDRRRQPR